MIFLITCGLIFGTYLLVIVWALWGIQKLKQATIKTPLRAPKSRFSIIIPFKDEAQNIPALLNSLQQLRYPLDLFELIFINDHSKDDGVVTLTEILKKSAFDYAILHCEDNNVFSKKEAITLGVLKAKHPWLITTDADCVVPKNWLQAFNATIVSNQKLQFLAAPVICNSQNTFVTAYQSLDFLSLQGLTMAGFGHKTPFLCNGANLAYTKEVFTKVKGFEGNFHLSSGDDVFMLQKVATAFPEQVGYVFNPKAIVKTNPVSIWNQVIQQRMRWASKTGKQKNTITSALGGLLVVTSMLFIVLIPSYLLEYIPGWLVVFLMFGKLLIDVIFLKTIAHFFQQKVVTGFFLLSFLLYPFITMAILVGSLLLKPKWKERGLRH